MVKSFVNPPVLITFPLYPKKIFPIYWSKKNHITIFLLHFASVKRLHNVWEPVLCFGTQRSHIYKFFLGHNHLVGCFMSILYKIFGFFGEPCDTCRIVLTVLLDKNVCLANRAHIFQLLTIVNNDKSLTPRDCCIPILKNKSSRLTCHNNLSPRCNASI